jgi:hypothetical protein
MQQREAFEDPHDYLLVYFRPSDTDCERGREVFGSSDWRSYRDGRYRHLALMGTDRHCVVDDVPRLSTLIRTTARPDQPRCEHQTLAD